jgi:hypothetical protein
VYSKITSEFTIYYPDASFLLRKLSIRPPLIDELVGLLSVSRVTAGAHCHVLVGALHNFPVVTTEICGGRKFRENFEAQNPHPKFS